MRLLIAAGGTAGHVRPALAVGEALRERGVTVTFAGTPDRVESRLVPEAGFELDTFPVSGLPRRPSAAQLRAAWRASAAPAHCRAAHADSPPRQAPPGQPRPRPATARAVPG